MNAILIALVNGIVVSGAVAVVVWTLLRLTPPHILNAATRHVVWCFTLIMVIAVPVLYMPSIQGIGALRNARTAETQTVPQVSRGQVTFAIAAPEESVPREHDRSSWLQLPIRVPGGDWPRWFLVAWLATSALLLIRLAVSFVLLNGRRGRAAEASTALQSRIGTWLLLCGRTRTGVSIATSTEIAIPMAVGPLRPSILLPAALVEHLDDDSLDRIGLHEMAHLVRRDDFVLIVERVLQAVFVFHPVVHWIARRIDLEREIACDDFVVAALGSPRAYAASLTRMVELCGGVHGVVAAPTAADDRSHLSQRIEMLLDKRRSFVTRPLKKRGAVLAGIVAGLAYLALRTPAMLALAVPAPPAAISPVAAPAPPAPVASEGVEEIAIAEEAPVEPVVPLRQVVCNVSVTDANRVPVGDLPQSAFTILEDGEAQAIARFERSDAPVSLGLLIDNSGSMQNQQLAATNAALQLVQASNPDDEAFVVNFNDEAFLDLPGSGSFTNRVSDIQTALNRFHARGGTALRDAIRVSLEHMQQKSRRERRALMLITDGGDNSSAISQADLLSDARQSGIPIYAIMLPNGLQRGELQRVQRQLTEIADVTGAQAYFPNIDTEVYAVVHAIAAGIRSRYLIEYSSTAIEGHEPAIHIEATIAGRPEFSTRGACLATK